MAWASSRMMMLRAEAMEFAGVAGRVREEAFEELDGGGDDDRSVPILGSELRPYCDVMEITTGGVLRTDSAVVFQDSRHGWIGTIKDRSIYVGGLLSNADEGDRHYYPPEPVANCMRECKCHSGAGLAPARGNAQAEESGLLFSSGEARLVYFMARSAKGVGALTG